LVDLFWRLLLRLGEWANGSPQFRGIKIQRLQPQRT